MFGSGKAGSAVEQHPIGLNSFMYQVYVIKNPFDKIYIGQTDNLDLRLRRHNGYLPSKSTSYTKINHGPWQLVYSERFETRSEALTREKFLKSHFGRNWIREKINTVNNGAVAQR